MKKLSLLFFSLLFIGLILTTVLFGQSAGDFRSAKSGNWEALDTWETYDGANWVPASSIPDSILALVPASVTTTILSPHNVTVAAIDTAQNVIVDPGATVTVNGTPARLYIATGGMTVNGTLTLTGNVPTATPFSVAKTTGTLTIGGSGVVNYDQTGASAGDKGALPIATWSTGSTLNVHSNGGSTASNWQGAGSAQNFYNINWDYPAQTANLGFGLVGSTIGGTININNTGTGRFMFFGGTGGLCRVNGDFIVSGSASATIMGSSNGVFDTVSIYGNVNINTTGNFSITRGSQGSGTGTAIWYLYGDVSIKAKLMQNSNTGTDVCKFIFKKAGTQNLSIIADSINSNAIPIEVSTGTTVTLTSPVNCTRLYLNGGMIISSSTNPLIMGWGSSWVGTTITSGSVSPTAPGSSTSYVNGPMAYLYATAAGVTTKVYPIGKDGIYRPLSLSLTQTTDTHSSYTAEMFNSAPLSNIIPGTLLKVSSGRYYKISEGAGGSAFTAGSVILNYDTDDGISDSTIVRIAQGPNGGGTWADLGGTGHGSPTGTINSSNAFTDLTTNTIFTLAKDERELTLTALIDGFYNGSTAVSDTVNVELHSATAPYTLVESRKGVLNTGGLGTFDFTTAVNSTPYYIVVKHRNAVQTWSGLGQSFTSEVLNYNFTSAVTQAYASNLHLNTGKYCIWSGDVNQDSVVNLADMIIVDNDNSHTRTGYINSDVNGEGVINLLDMVIVDNSNSKSVRMRAPGFAKEVKSIIPIGLNK